MRPQQILAVGLVLTLTCCDKPTLQPTTDQPTSRQESKLPVTSHISGQVFITSSSAEVIPLPLVNILVYKFENVNAYIRAKQASSDEIARKLESRLQRAQKTLEEEGASQPKGIQELEQLFDQLPGATPSLAVTSTPKDQNHIPSPTELYRNGISFMTKMRYEYLRDYKSWPTSKFYFTELPKADFTAISDSAGHFNIEVPSDTVYVIAAVAKREVAGAIEVYYWMIKVDASKNQIAVMLANHNSTTSSSPDSLITCKSNELHHSIKEEIIGSGVFSGVINADVPPEF